MLKAETILDKIPACKAVAEDWIIEAQRELFELQHDTSRKNVNGGLSRLDRDTNELRRLAYKALYNSLCRKTK